jgi:hypothetical protein
MRCRKILALVLVAAFAFAVAVPGGAASDVFAPLVAVWFVLQPDVVVVVAIDPAPPAEQPVALQSLRAFRAPPASVSA